MTEKKWWREFGLIDATCKECGAHLWSENKNSKTGTCLNGCDLKRLQAMRYWK